MALYQDVAPWSLQEVRESVVHRPLREQPLLQVPFLQRAPVWGYQDVLREGDGHVIAQLESGPMRTAVVKARMRPQNSLASAFHPPYVTVGVGGAFYHIRVGATVSLPQPIVEALLNSVYEVEVS